MALAGRGTKRDYKFSKEDMQNMLDAVKEHQETVNAWGLNAKKIKAKAWSKIAVYVNQHEFNEEALKCRE